MENSIYFNAIIGLELCHNTPELLLNGVNLIENSILSACKICNWTKLECYSCQNSIHFKLNHNSILLIEDQIILPKQNYFSANLLDQNEQIESFVKICIRNQLTKRITLAIQFLP